MHRTARSVIAIVVLAGTPSFAQYAGWTANGTNTTTTNTVAIGTSSAPAAQLEIANGDVLVAIHKYYRARNSYNNFVPLAGVGSGTFGVAAGYGDLQIMASANVNGFQLGSIYAGVAGIWAGSSTQLSFHTNTVERVRIDSAGNVGIGVPSPLYKLDVNGATHVNGLLQVEGDIAAKYQDVAEWVPTVAPVPEATVVVLDPARSNHVVPSTSAYDTTVAGVISGKPGVILGERAESKVKVATMGRVRVKVDATAAPIRIGDLLVTSDKPGVAMRSIPVEVSGIRMHRPGTVLGKALEPLERGEGEILVLLTLQ